MQPVNRRTAQHVFQAHLDSLERTIMRPSMLLVLLACLLLVGCRATPLAASSQPAIVEPTDREGINLITLTERAAERLDIQTTQIREEQVNGAMRMVVPYSAIIYDLRGDTWLYTSPDHLTYLREPITVDFIEGDVAVLIDGPAIGTTVVIVGVAELYGADTGIGK
jgi:hypothetical protein